MKIYDVFISYRRSDGLAKAEALYRYLTEKGLRVFFDKHEMVDGHYFTEQIEEQLRTVPNYVLVATDDVFRFRQGEDWVRTEMQIALQMYEQAPADRSIVVLTEDKMQFPLKEALPADVCKIADVQRVVLCDAQEQEAAFERILRAVTQVSHQNLWRAAHRWLENSKCPGGRFANLSIVQSILPNAEQAPGLCDIPVNVSDKPGGSGSVQALFDAVAATRSHLFLIGQGGIGKTTALMHLMNETYVERPYSRCAQIPIFVELSFAPDMYDRLYEGGRSSFIRRSIYKQLRTDRTLHQVEEEEVSDIDEVFMLPYKVAVTPIDDILSHATPAPEYLLLLDGLNEVSTAFLEQTNSTVVKMIAEEINMLMTRCPNVRVVLTSRSDEVSVSDQPMDRLYLTGVDETAIRTYLQECRVMDVDRLMRNRALVQTLKTPLFLTLYGSLANREEVSTQGEIFRLFFNERRKNVSIYTVQGRLTELERNIHDTAGMNQRNRLTAPMQWFILDFLLPEIAWHMEREGQFYLRPSQIAQIIRPVLEDRSDISVCGDFGKDLFAKYQQGSAADIHTQSVAEDILQRLGRDISGCTEKIINCCTLALGILQRSGRKYGFIHQHIRDYFAAMKNINTMRLALFMQEEQEQELALECINTVLHDLPVGRSVRNFIGQVLGEHHNKPVYRDGVYHDNVDTASEDRTLISRVLDVYRGYFDGQGGYGQYTLLKILSEVRGSLMGCDLSRLDLSGCQLNGATLGLPGLAANLDGALLREKDLFFNGHTDPIYHFDISPDGSKMLTGTRKEIKLWDVRTGNLLKVFTTLDALPGEEPDFFGQQLKDLLYLQFVDNDTMLLVDRVDSARGVRIRKESLWFGKGMDYVIPQLDAGGIQISASKTRLLLSSRRRDTSEHAIWVLNIEDLQPVFQEHFPRGFARVGFLSGDNRQLQVVYSKTERKDPVSPENVGRSSVRSFIETWDLSSGTCIKTQLAESALNTTNLTICNGKLFAAHTQPGESEMVLEALDLQTGAVLKTIPLPTSRLCKLVCNRTESTIAVILEDRVCVYDTTDYQQQRVIRQRISRGFFGPEDKTLALADTQGNLALYEYPTMQLKTKLTGAGSGYKQDCVAFCGDSKMVATITGAGDLRLWDAQTVCLVNERSVTRIYKGELEGSHDGKYLYYHGEYRSAIYRTADLVCVYAKSSGLCVHPQGKYLAALRGMDSAILDPEDFHELCSWPYAGVCAFLGDLAVVKEYTGELAKRTEKPIWRAMSLRNVQTGEIYSEFFADVHEDFCAAAVSERLIAAASDGNLYVWDLRGTLVFKCAMGAKGVIPKMEFTGDGKFLIVSVGFFTTNITVYETERFAVVEQFGGGISYQLSGSPSGKWLIESKDAAHISAFEAERLGNRKDTSESARHENVLNVTGGAAISRDDKCLAVITGGLFRVKLEASSGAPGKRTFVPAVPGLRVKGVNLQNLHPESTLSEHNLYTLRRYGAMVNLP